MKILLKNIGTLLTEKKLNTTQALYLIYLHNGEEVYINRANLKKLIEDKYVIGNKLNKTLLEEKKTLSNSKQVVGTIPPIHELPLSRDICKYLCIRFCIKNDKKEVVFPGDTYNTAEKTAKEFLQNEQLVVYHFMIFLYLFPVADSTNKKWEKEFMRFTYKGPRLRLRSKQMGRLFLAMAKNKDMGVALFATYLYIRDSIEGNKTYIMKPNRFLKEEFKEWYNSTYEKVEKAKTVEELFRKTRPRGDSLRITV